MKLKVNVRVDIKAAKVMALVDDAVDEALRDTVVATARDVVKGSPVLTGHNRRSIGFTLKKLSARIFSTSGYGGWLEIGTSRMAAQPYFKPAADKNFWKLPRHIRARLKVRGG